MNVFRKRRSIELPVLTTGDRRALPSKNSCFVRFIIVLLGLICIPILVLGVFEIIALVQVTLHLLLILVRIFNDSLCSIGIAVSTCDPRPFVLLK